MRKKLRSTFALGLFLGLGFILGQLAKSTPVAAADKAKPATAKRLAVSYVAISDGQPLVNWDEVADVQLRSSEDLKLVLATIATNRPGISNVVPVAIFDFK